MSQKWKDVPGETEFALAVSYKHSGYYDPGIYSGPMEGSYPAEGECDVELVGMTLNEKPVPKELAEKIFDLISEAIEAEVSAEEPPEYDPPDRD